VGELNRATTTQWTTAMRKYRPFDNGVVNGSNRPKGDLQVRGDERLENALKRPLRVAQECRRK